MGVSVEALGVNDGLIQQARRRREIRDSYPPCPEMLASMVCIAPFLSELPTRLSFGLRTTGAMGRHCRQLLDTGCMEESIGRDGRIDLFWIDSLLEFPGADSGEPLDTAAISCVLVNLDRSDESVAALRGLSESLNGVRVTLQGVGGADIADSISAALALRNDDFASAIVWIAPGTGKASEGQRVVDALTRDRRDETGLVTVFKAGKTTFDEQEGVDGYLTSREPHGAAAAAQLLAALGSMAAPILMTCLDAEDIRPSLGYHQHPASLVQAVWSPIRKRLATPP